MTYPTKSQRRLPSVAGHNYPHPEKRQYKQLPMFGKGFVPERGMVPVGVFIGSSEAIEVTQVARFYGDRSRVCIKPGDDPTRFNWSFLHSLPVVVYAEESVPLETVHSLMIEIARCGASHIAALQLSGKVIAFYSPETGRAAA